MIDIKLVREQLELLKKNCTRRGCQVDLDQLAADDAAWRAAVQKIETMRAERNRLSKECKDNPAAREQVRELKAEMEGLEVETAELFKKVETQLSWLPNLLADDVPDGKDDADNLELRKEGIIPEFSFKPRDHQELGEMLDIIDTARGAKVAQAGFYFWKGKGAILCQSLFFWTQMELVKRGFTLFMSPCAAKSKTLYGTGYLPFFADQTYGLSGEDLALIGTSEQTLVGYHADEVLDESKLPLLY
ncbi:MAG: hypothetical protein PHT71_07150, partial [Victivallaceae bacterium]|nr:hypothetical protein [Victivallaceae bacterium]